MAQNQQTGLLGQYLTVNTAANTTALSSALVVGNSSVNVVVNSSSVYVNGAPLGGAVNVAAQFAWTNTHSFSGVVTHNANVVLGTAGISANGSYGTANQVLTSNGSTTYWASASGGFTNGQSISVNNFVVSGTVTANGSAGAAGQTLVSNGAGVNWSSLVPSYNYSAQFNGSSQYLTSSSATAFAFGSGVDFTVEAWVFPLAYGASPVGASIVGTVNGAGTGWSLNLGQDINNFRLVSNASGTWADNIIAGTGNGLALNTWTHVALVRNGATISLYKNGVSVGTAITTGSAYNFTAPSNLVNIGYFNDGGNVRYLNGYISNVRIVKGVAVYTGNFTVPTSPLQTTQSAGTNIAAVTGTQTTLLTCSALTLTDSSSFNNVITNNSGVVASATSNPPFTYSSVSIPTTSLTSLRQSFTGDGSTTVFNIAGGYTPGTLSVYYNGLMLRNGSDVTATNGATITMAIAPQSGALIDVVGTVPTTYSSITPQGYSVQFNGSNYLSVADSAALQPGSSNFTVEAWIYPTAFAGSANGASIISKTNSASLSPYILSFSSTGQLGVLVSNNGSNWAVNISTPAISLNSWYHVALVRNSSTVTLYVNGLAANSGSVSGTVYASAGNALMIGNGNYGGSYFTGYISNARVVVGTAVYTAPFTPVGPLTAVQSATSMAAAITGTQTGILTCNAPTIVDGSTNAFTITNNGTSTVSTAIVPTFTNVTINAPTPYYSANYLIVGGGGGGAALFGAGGAGGLITGSSTLIVGTTYSITVGSGGSGGTSGTTAVNGGSGGFSSFNGLTAIGGGGGGAQSVGLSGGSGGGGGGWGATSYAAGSGTTGQGNAGGAGSSADVGGGGGGGAGGTGAVGTSSGGGAGGVGLASSITGSSVYYAGGGGGGTYTGTVGTAQGGAGGTGGGGAGGQSGGSGGSANGNPGTTNTGGGGGGGTRTAQSVGGGAGGSGVVILSILTSNYTGTKTGSPTVTTNGSYTILTFTASGSYTA